ncbi:uncharacterized protein B0I36DRAFT_387463 [Microdochium trichocladiopsis]|uniref:Uncharacterized protein n=1 Tax=Microdochium trichocladiopsis TaxID=1682393 RepID=A0A9P8XXJ9_9PEZI|nr:uncharacterized protein B0I36DRAFT_387463 [Microdochium trichocladiopsis]KAH7025094.1 hypothetical protein B0I36DRAFT_387463 [Microdochium trichocladiopsis]
MYAPAQLKIDTTRLAVNPLDIPDENIDTCQFNTYWGTWDHTVDCPMVWSDPDLGSRCPMEGGFASQKQHLRLRWQPFFKNYFEHPELAAWHGDMDKYELLISQWDILSQWRDLNITSLGQFTFKGLLVQEGWHARQYQVMSSFVLPVFVFLAVFVAWLVYGEWATAWQVAGCVIAAMSLGVYTKHCEERKGR